ncbi:MAG: NTF2 fold immunity protein [Verrucomicrobiales bacterium]|nr:NTF2 fold immunity protein [Verrucomicrobiales bacterium]
MEDTEIEEFLTRFIREMAAWERFAESELARVERGELLLNESRRNVSTELEKIATNYCDPERIDTKKSSFSTTPRYDEQTIESVAHENSVFVVETQTELSSGGIQRFRYEIESVDGKQRIVDRRYFSASRKSWIQTSI